MDLSGKFTILVNGKVRGVTKNKITNLDQLKINFNMEIF